jgi:hypothetical protein
LAKAFGVFWAFRNELLNELDAVSKGNSWEERDPRLSVVTRTAIISDSTDAVGSNLDRVGTAGRP